MTGRSIEEAVRTAAESIRAGVIAHWPNPEYSPSTWRDYAGWARRALYAVDLPGLLDRLEQTERERDAHKKAKAENDDRFMLERDEARAERDRLRAQVEAVEAQVRRQVARDLAAWLDAVFAPPIWHRAVSIADPTFCIMCPHCDGSWEGCQHCDGGFIEDGPVGPQPTEPKEEGEQ